MDGNTLLTKCNCITTATYSKWLVVKEEGSFVNDDAVAQHLLSVHERLESDDR